MKKLRTELDKRKFEMACTGYYLPAEIARIKKVSRQHIGRLIDQGKFETKHAYCKNWVKHDNGELAKTLYQEDVNPLFVFKRFGFNQRLRGLVSAENLVCDINLIDGLSKISINFYDEHGNILQLLSDISTINFDLKN